MALLSKFMSGPARTTLPVPINAGAGRHADTGSISLRALSRTTGNFTLGADVFIKAADPITCKSATIEGALDATLDTHTLTIARGGSVHGCVHANNAEIRGEFDGELIVRGKLVVYSSARVTGKIRFGEIVLWKGGHVSGNVKRLARPDAPKNPSRKHRPELVSESRLMGAEENPETTSHY
jgi:cytoskeletal protein CcmA (bactofilin family)